MDAIRYVQIRGVGLYVDEGALKAFPASRLTSELRSFIRDHRDDLIAALATPDIETTVGNILALQPHELEALRAEIAATPDNDPTIAFDRAALAKAEPILAKRRQQRQESERAA